MPDVFVRTKFDLSNRQTFDIAYPSISECMKRNDTACTDSLIVSVPSNKAKVLHERVSYLFGYLCYVVRTYTVQSYTTRVLRSSITYAYDSCARS